MLLDVAEQRQRTQSNQNTNDNAPANNQNLNNNNNHANNDNNVHNNGNNNNNLNRKEDAEKAKVFVNPLTQLRAHDLSLPLHLACESGHAAVREEMRNQIEEEERGKREKATFFFEKKMSL